MLPLSISLASLCVISFPVILDLNDEEADKLLLLYDPISQMIKTEKDKLEALMQNINTGEEALQKAISEMAEREGLSFMQEEPAPDPGAQVDKAQELLDKWGVKSGDVWQVGRHRVVCGDCTDKAVVEACLQGDKAQMMVTDPPYGVEYDASWRDGVIGEFGPCARQKGVIQNDNSVDWSNAYTLFAGDVSYIWCASWFLPETAIQIKQTGFDIRALLIWRKQHFAVSRGHYHWQHEPCWYAVRKGKKSFWCGDRKQSTIWDISSLNPAGRTEERYQHSTQKPVECMARPIRNHGEEGWIIYDPFLGSGTTIVAAEQLNRIGRGIEISPAYVAVTLERLAGMGLEANRVG